MYLDYVETCILNNHVSIVCMYFFVIEVYNSTTKRKLNCLFTLKIISGQHCRMLEVHARLNCTNLTKNGKTFVRIDL